MTTPSNLPPIRRAEPLTFPTDAQRPYDWRHVATIGDHPVLIDANADARVLLELLDNAETLGDMVASHKFCRETLGDQYQLVKDARLTGPQWNELGALIVGQLTGTTDLPTATPAQVARLEELRQLLPGALGGTHPSLVAVGDGSAGQDT